MHAFAHAGCALLRRFPHTLILDKKSKSSHNMTIEVINMATVNIAKLKAELSSYIKLVEKGKEVIVTDHKKPVIKLVPVDKKKTPRLQVIKATRPISDLKDLEFPDPAPDMDIVALLREDRDAR